MALSAYLRPGFPKFSETENSFKYSYEYRGLLADIEPDIPVIGDEDSDHEDFYVTNISTEPLENSLYIELTVETEMERQDDDEADGTVISVTHEVEWAAVSRSMYEHPEFRAGGLYALTDADITEIESWRNNPNAEYKAEFIFREDGDYTKPVTALDPALSANAQKFAQGILLGIESWDDFAPVLRKTSTYINGGPDETTAGEKEVPTFPKKPDGYEFRKSADRSLKAGRKSRWERTEEWMGAEKVLVDRKKIYW